LLTPKNINRRKLRHRPRVSAQPLLNCPVGPVQKAQLCSGTGNARVCCRPFPNWLHPEKKERFGLRWPFIFLPGVWRHHEHHTFCLVHG
jgi:hypothetical protein